MTMSQIETEAAPAATQHGKAAAAFLLTPWVLVPIAALLLAAAFLLSPGQFNIDEFIDFAGAKAFLATGGFAVQNGLPGSSSHDLNLLLLISGPHGLAPQYPVGSAIVGAPLLAAFGMRGLMLTNVLAGIGTLFVLWSLAARHFGGKAVALVSVALLVAASFWFEYVHAIWPHSVGVLCVTAAFLLILGGLDGGRNLGLKSLAAGAIVGFGFLCRTVTVLAFPALGLIAILVGERPFRMGAFFGLGLAPFVALACAVNEAKFGTLNPLSYGQSGGNTDLPTHLPAIAALALVSLALVASRFTRWRPGRREYAIGLVALGLAFLFSATLRDLAQRYLSGAWALVVDATTVHDPRPGVQHQPGGVLTFWGLWKKALGQSMPWLGLLFLAVHMRLDAGLRRSQRAVLILAGVWSLPFFMTDWHGGMGSNMRYLLPLVPALCALSARYLLEFARPIANAPRILLLGAFAGALAVALWGALAPTGGGGAQQILSTWILAAVASLALLSGVRWRGQGVVRTVCLGVIGIALAASASYLLSDIRQAQHVRADAQARSLAMADLPDRTLAYVPGPFVTRWGLQPGHILAMPDDHHIFDTALIDQALADGYRVLVAPPYATRRLHAHYGQRLVGSGLPFAGGGEFLEVKAQASQTRP
jgi:hypothetical protein